MKLSSKHVWAMAGMHIFLMQASYWLWNLGFIERQSGFEWLVGFVFSMVARIIAVVLFVRIASEYGKNKVARLTWYALAANSLLLLGRGLVTNVAMAYWGPDYEHTAIRGLVNHGFSVPASVLLVLALIGMFQSYRRAGLGSRLTKFDYVLISVSVALFGSLLLLHETLEEGRSPWLINRILQPIDLALIAITSVISIVLYRYTAAIQGGKLARVMAFIVLYGLLPGVLVLLLQVIVPSVRIHFPFNSEPLGDLWRVAGWMATLAAATRAELTREAISAVKQLRSDAARKNSKDDRPM